MLLRSVWSFGMPGLPQGVIFGTQSDDILPRLHA